MDERSSKPSTVQMLPASPVSRAYRQLGTPEPPPALDAAIARHARLVLTPPPATRPGDPAPARWRPAWFAPFTLAASVLLSAVLMMVIAIRPAQRRIEAPVQLIHAVATREDRAQLRYPSPAAPAILTTRSEGSAVVAPLIPARRLYSTDPPGSYPPATPASPPLPVQDIRRDPRAWQMHISQLERDGHRAEAQEQRRALHEAYPDRH